MNSTTTLLRASRPIFSNSQFAASQTKQAFSRATVSRNAFRQHRQGNGRRWQSSTADSAQQAGWFKRMWDSPIGFKTVHFWAPVMKWALVLAGVSDFARPAEKLSLTQNGALTLTGAIWTRWCFVIKPKNYLLAAVNFFLGLVGVIQVSRILIWQNSQKKLPAAVEDAKDAAKDAVKSS